MILKVSSYAKMVENIKKNKRDIIVYGVGMIGQSIIPYIVQEYNLYDNIKVFVDMDERKKGKKIEIDGRQYEITIPDYLRTMKDDCVILITNSNFLSIINFLDSIDNLNNSDGYIIPMMQIYDLEQMDTISIVKQTNEQLIPKKIHYCWFGHTEIPSFLKKCIKSWKLLCPDYQIIEWNENNYDVNRYDFTREAYQNGKYGFVTDIARWDILYECGGIYFDTDVTLLHNLDSLLFQEGFIGVEKWGNINSGGGCGFIPKHPMIKELLDYRRRFHFIQQDSSFNIETNGIYETKVFANHGFKPNNKLQIIDNVTVYPSYINHPYDYMSKQMNKNESTISVHHFYGGWMDENDKISRENTQNQYQGIEERIKNGGSPSRRHK